MNYSHAAILIIGINAIVYSTIIPITHDTYSYTEIVQNESEYPPLFPLLAKATTLLVPETQSTTITAIFFLGSVIILVILPYFVFEFFVAYTKDKKTAFMGLFAYLFGTGITNYFYYSNIYSQALATSIFFVMMVFLMRKEWVYAIICLILIALSHRVLIYYALFVFIYYILLVRRNINLMPAYCLYKTGEISTSKLCLIPFFVVVYPIFWIFSLRNLTFKTDEDKVFVFASIIPIFLMFYDLRSLLMTFSFFSLLIGKEMMQGRKRLIVMVACCIMFSVFSYFYMQDLVQTSVLR